MSSMSTQWSVIQVHEVRPEDLGDDSRVTDAAIVRWIAAARDEYLGQCTQLEEARARSGLELQHQIEGRPDAAALTGSKRIRITATATEVFPTSFVVALRIRPLDGEDDTPVNIACAVRLVQPETGEPAVIDDRIRDELIALAHAARHFN